MKKVKTISVGKGDGGIAPKMDALGKVLTFMGKDIEGSFRIVVMKAESGKDKGLGVEVRIDFKLGGK